MKLAFRNPSSFRGNKNNKINNNKNSSGGSTSGYNDYSTSSWFADHSNSSFGSSSSTININCNITASPIKRKSFQQMVYVLREETDDDNEDDAVSNDNEDDDVFPSPSNKTTTMIYKQQQQQQDRVASNLDQIFTSANNSSNNHMNNSSSSFSISSPTKMINSVKKEKNHLMKYSKSTASNTNANQLLVSPPICVVVPSCGSTHTTKSTSKSLSSSSSSTLSLSSTHCSIAPQTYLDTLIHSRGYHTPAYHLASVKDGITTTTKAIYSAGNGECDNKSSKNHCSISQYDIEYDYASYGFYTVGIVQMGDIELLHTCLSAGISPNACDIQNQKESLVQIICQKVDYKSLQILINFGCNLDTITDHNGYNPLHDICQACNTDNISSCLETAKVILKYCAKQTITPSPQEENNDIMYTPLRLFYKPDKTGALPLAYIKQEHYDVWIQFLAKKKDELLISKKLNSNSNHNTKNHHHNQKQQMYVPHCYNNSNNGSSSRRQRIVEPLPLDVVRMVACGKLPPEQARKYVRKYYGSNRSTNTNTYYHYNNNVVSNITYNQRVITATQVDNKHDITCYNEVTVCEKENQDNNYNNNTQSITLVLPSPTKSNKYPYDSGREDNDIDSTAYADSIVSGIEFFTEDLDRNNNDPIILPSTDIHNSFNNDVDSTAYPASNGDSSGVEFYNYGNENKENQNHYQNNKNDDNDDEYYNDHTSLTGDSTGIPDSLSGVDSFVCD